MGLGLRGVGWARRWDEASATGGMGNDRASRGCSTPGRWWLGSRRRSRGGLYVGTTQALVGEEWLPTVGGGSCSTLAVETAGWWRKGGDISERGCGGEDLRVWGFEGFQQTYKDDLVEKPPNISAGQAHANLWA